MKRRLDAERQGGETNLEEARAESAQDALDEAVLEIEGGEAANGSFDAHRNQSRLLLLPFVLLDFALSRLLHCRGGCTTEMTPGVSDAGRQSAGSNKVSWQPRKIAAGGAGCHTRAATHAGCTHGGS
jgi:hypothetical protein